MTNPSPGEPETRENPLVRFGCEYIYSSRGHLIKYVRKNPDLLSVNATELTDEQKKMVMIAANMPIVYDEDCPKSSPERLEAFRNVGIPTCECAFSSRNVNC